MKKITDEQKKSDSKVAEKQIYERPMIFKVGKFSEVTRGSAGSLAFDFYLSDYT